MSNTEISANIISDGCRDYVVAIQQAKGSELIRDRKGQVRRFASLSDAKQTVRRANVHDIRLSIRVAADEACAGATLQDSGFATLKVASDDPRASRSRRTNGSVCN